MAEKPNGKTGAIKEQIIEDPVLEMTLQFSVDKKGCTKLTIFGDFPFGNREHLFYPDGSHMGSGTHLAQCPVPSWLAEVMDRHEP